LDTGIDSVTIMIDGKRGSAELTQSQPTRRAGARSGEELLDCAVRDARAWLAANGGRS
jgi:hypothetical protein